MFRRLTLNINNRRINKECQIEGIWLPCVILLYLGKRPFGICADRDSELYKREQTLFGRPDKNDSIVICSPPSKWWHRQYEWVPDFNWQCWHIIRIWCPPWVFSKSGICQYLAKLWQCDVEET
ncbi:MAG: hypothetical protein UT11_C0005G0032 [Berkelbacteria bacterium GW2011_GWA2_38_9]|uniref:Uncharacterized protein n=1 Tax=Berkelbacteria bacterium GW2011_GWA2_38_9 TaxID=1618334 RepID=A0A0G0PMF5_9BACT|nr:MAG: hypothetical protein UT11_C0005G0032 [Berkelbacteria bacterium GW2011_GWA2_38_9]